MSIAHYSSRVRSLGLSLALLVMAIAGFATGQRTASAHAEPGVVKPGDGAVLNEAPTTYEIKMSQDMFKDNAGSNDIDIFDASGAEVTRVAAVIDNADRSRLSVVLPSNLAPGEYRVEWKTLSADDGDSANGTLTFTYDPGAAPSPGTEVLKENMAPAPENTPSGVSGAVTGNQPSSLSGRGSGVTWVTTIAVGFMTFVLGAGVTYIVLERKK